MSAIISVQLDAVEALAAELALLATALADETPLCVSTAGSLAVALGGAEGEWAAGAGRGWAALARVLSDETGAIAATLSAAVEAYRQTDALLSQRVGPGPLGRTAIAR